MGKIKPLKKCKYLEGFTNREVASVGAIAQERTLAAGESLFAEGSPADAMVILAAGELQVTTQGQSLQTLQEPGQTLGELALLGGGDRAVGVTAAVDSQVVVVSAQGFGELQEREPAVALKLLGAIAAEVGEIARATATHVKTILGGGDG